MNSKMFCSAKAEVAKLQSFDAAENRARGACAVRFALKTSTISTEPLWSISAPAPSTLLPCSSPWQQRLCLLSFVSPKYRL